jgi:hypothetical protein
MPDLNHHPYKRMAKDLPVEKHTIVVNKYDLWKKRLDGKKYAQLLYKINNGYLISRSKLLNYKYKNNEDKCLDILLWGYPNGGRGNNIKKSISEIANIAKNVSNKKLAWEDYLKKLKGTGVGVATASKFAYFFKLTFEGQRALILDQRIAYVLETRVWGESLSPVGLYQDDWSRNYLRYLDEMSNKAKSIGCSGDQLELFLYLFGKVFN